MAKTASPVGAPASRIASRIFTSAPDPAGVRAGGARLRESTPVSRLGVFEPAPHRPDPVDLVDETNTGRMLDLAAIRVGRMVASPFAFLRGAAGLMGADLAGSASTGLNAQICGDAHASNFGLYASPERHLIMDVNDFDETIVGPWEWDLKRLVASVLVAGRAAGMHEEQSRVAAIDCANTYRAAAREMAGMHVLDAYYLITDHSTLHHFDIADLLDSFDRVRKKARKNTSRKAAVKLAERVEHDTWRFTEQPPVLTHVSDAVAEAVVKGLETYADELDDELRWVLSRFTVTDVAHRVVGLGSVGLRSYVVLLHGNSEDALVLQVKQATASALAPYLPPSPYAHEGERTVRGQRWMQTVSDVFLGWTTIDGQPFLVRQFRDMKGSIDPSQLKAHQLDDYARVVGAVLARSHAQSIDPRVLSGYCDGASEAEGEAFDEALGAFAVGYADQVEVDHAALVAAVRNGRLPVTMDV